MVDKVEKLVQAVRVAVRDQTGKTTPVSTGAVAPPHAVERNCTYSGMRRKPSSHVGLCCAREDSLF